MIPLTGWDWLVLVVCLASTCLGLWRGAVRTLFGLGAWVVGIIAAPLVASAAIGLPGIDSVPIWVLFIVAFLLVFVIVRYAGALILRGIRSIGLGGVDRVFGGALGVARAAVIVLVAALVGFRLGMAQDSAWTQARSRPLLDWLVAKVDPLLPETRLPATMLPTTLLPMTPTPAGPARDRASRREAGVSADGVEALATRPVAIIYLPSALQASPRQPQRGA